MRISVRVEKSSCRGKFARSHPRGLRRSKVVSAKHDRDSTVRRQVHRFDEVKREIGRHTRFLASSVNKISILPPGSKFSNSRFGVRTAGTLVLGVAEQLNHTALIGGKADDLASDLADERSAAGRLALGTADLVLGGVKGSGFL
jgi:hypothetical protein